MNGPMATPRRDSKGRFLPPTPEHNHLDQQRRQPGECPMCDVLWAVQTQRLQQKNTKAETQIENLTAKELARWEKQRTAERIVREARVREKVDQILDSDIEGEQ